MDVPELMPMDDYDPQKAQFKSSILWVLCKAYGNDIPADLEWPFYENPRGDLCLKPAAVIGLSSADVYCKACANIIPSDSSTKWKGHWSVIQQLSRKGIYLADVTDADVTESVLMQASPFQQNAHMALITSLMMAYIREVVTVERVVNAVKRFAAFSASSELPYDAEDALMFWINKVSATLQKYLDDNIQQPAPENESMAQQSVCSGMTHILCSLVSRPNHDQSQPQGPAEVSGKCERLRVPQMDDLLKDISDGCCIGALISFYCPSVVSATDFALHHETGIADSLFNIQLILDFCDIHLPERCSHLDLNDLFYTHEDLKAPVLALLADLFYWFEVKPAKCVRDTSKPYQMLFREHQGSRPTTAQQLSSGLIIKPQLPISNATKLSFLQNPFSSPTDGTYINLDHPSPGTRLPARQPLLPKRLNQRTVVHGEGDIPCSDENRIRGSRRAWEDSDMAMGHTNPTGNPYINSKISVEDIPGSHRSTLTTVTQSRSSQFSGRSLLSNVSIDSEMDLDMTDSSIDVDSSVSRVRMQNEGDIEVVSMASQAMSGPASRSTTVEPLLPAVLKPAKEKLSNHTKEVESGETVARRSPGSPVKPRSLNLTRQDSSGSSTDEEYATPSVESMPLPGEKQEKKSHSSKPSDPGRQGETLEGEKQDRKAGRPRPAEGAGVPQNTRTKQYEAFYVDTEAIDGVPSMSQTSAVAGKPVQQSFTLHEQLSSEQARAAGIPVVDGSQAFPSPHRREDHSSPVRASHRREERGSPGRTSHGREEHDAELEKIHADHRDREVKDSEMSNSFFLNQEAELANIGQRPDSLNVQKFAVDPDEKPSPKTSFAQIKKQKDNGQVSPILYLQKTPHKGALKTGGEHQKSAKKTSFAALPNQTTWQESAQRKTENEDSNRAPAVEAMQPMPSELHDIRMRLEERRRQIESTKHRMEVQWNKQRQRLGKQAFIQVITKGKSEESSPAEGEPGMVDGRNAKEEQQRASAALAEEQRRRLEQQAEAQRMKEAERLREEKARREAKEKAWREAEIAKAHEEERARQMQIAKEKEKRREPQKERDAIKAREEEKQKEADRNRNAERDFEYQKEKLRKLLEDKEEELMQERGEETRRSSSEREVSRSRTDRIRGRNGELDKSHRSFSREDIQETIDSVRNRWFSSKENSLERRKKNRPMSYTGPDEPTPPPAQPMSLSDHAERERHVAPAGSEELTNSTGSVGSQQSGDYTTSLDKLNNSLSELQSEIMKLSVQQDQIKKDRPQIGTPPSTARSTVSPPRDSTPYYTQQGEPDVAEGQRDARQSGQPPRMPSMPPGHVNGQPVHLTGQPGMYAPSQHQHAMPYQPAMYGMEQTAYQYPYMPGQPVHGGQGHLGPFPMAFPGSQALYQQQMYGTALSQSGSFAGQGQWQAASAMPYAMAPTMAPAPPTLPMQSVAQNAMLHSPSVDVTAASDIFAPHPDINSQPLSTSGTSLPSPRSPPPRSSPEAHSNGPESPPPEISAAILSPGTGPSWLNRPPGEARVDPMSVSDDRESASGSASPPPPPQPAGPAEGFFISFEDTASPKRQKPKLKSARDRHKDQTPTPREEEESSGPPPVSAIVDSPGNAAGKSGGEGDEAGQISDKSPRPPSPPRLPVNTSPGVGFVIDVEPKEMSEIEKKKQKILNMQLKRKLESEKKLQKLEKERLKKQELKQQKQEEAEMKKAEEKARREAIFQQYQQKKMDQAIAEEEAKTGISIPRKPKAKPKTARPKSQPTVSALLQEDKHSLSSQSHSSQEDLYPKAGGNSVPYSDANTEHVEPAFPLAYGGLTHRRPPSPGPRLYVKPSHKSNRTIIQNAISHCCLAGTVNNDVKNKVIADINQSDGNYFLILFRDAAMQYRAVYSYNPDNEEVIRIHGNGPRQLSPKMMERFYKYNSGGKSFTEVTSMKHLSVSIDAIVIYNHYWQKKKPAAYAPQY